MAWAVERCWYEETGESAAILRPTGEGGAEIEVRARIYYDPAGASADDEMDQAWKRPAAAIPPVRLGVAGRPAILSLLRHFYGGYMGSEVPFEPPAWRFELRLAVGDGPGGTVARFSVCAEKEVLDSVGYDPPPPPDPAAAFPSYWHETLGDLKRAGSAALTLGPLAAAARALFERTEPLDERVTARLVSVETRADDGPPIVTKWAAGMRVRTAARPGSRMEAAFRLERTVVTVRVAGIERRIEADAGRNVRLASRSHDGNEHVVEGTADADGVCRCALPVGSAMAMPFRIRLSQSPVDDVEGEIALRWGREIEETLDRGTWVRSELPQQPDEAALGRAVAEDLCRAYDPDHHRFRNWRGTAALDASGAEPDEVLLLDGVDLESSADPCPDAALLLRQIRLLRDDRPRAHGVCLRKTGSGWEWQDPADVQAPSGLAEQARRNMPEDPYWDAPLAQNVLELLDAGECAAAGDLAAMLASRMQRLLSPVRLDVSKRSVGIIGDPDAPATRALAAFALARAAVGLGRPDLLPAAVLNIEDLTAARSVAEGPLRTHARVLAAAAACADAGERRMGDRRSEIEAAVWQRLVARGQERDIEDTLEVLRALLGILPWRGADRRRGPRTGGIAT